MAALQQQLASLESLGAELRRLGWTKHLEQLRALYRATRDGGSAAWTPEHAARLGSVLGVGEHQLPIASACPRCPPPAPATWAGSRTVMHLPDRWVSACAKCGAEWVTKGRR